VIGKQLMRSGTSVGANYRSACHAQSRAAFLAKLAIVEEEADETQFWLELLADLDLGTRHERTRLYDEARQLTAIVVASRKTAKRNRR
jgi:four helix bundle protein